MTLPLSELKRGTELPEVKKRITQEKIGLYAQASRDLNPIHIDPNFASKTPLGGTIAHGMLVLAYVSQMMTEAFGKSWLASGELDVRFKTPARPGDVLTISGKIYDTEENKGQLLVSCDVLCQNQKGEPVTIGTARVRV